MDEIDYDLFAKIDLRVGEIISAEDVEGADKLLCLKIDIGSITKTIFAGIKKFYEPERCSTNWCDKSKIPLWVNSLKFCIYRTLQNVKE